MIDMHRLAIWRAVVASGSVHSAAANLRYTPATVSQHIIRLQKDVGLSLYQRLGRGIQPTPEGLRLAEQSDDVFSSMRRLEMLLDDLRRGPSPQLNIGCFSSVAKEWMPNVVSELVAQFPDVQFEISIIRAADTPGRKTCDIEVRTEIPSETPAPIPGYHRSVLYLEKYVLVVAAGHPFADESRVTMAALAHERWVDPDIHNTPAGRVVKLACHAAGFEPRYTAGSDDHYAALAMVAAGIGITVLPLLAARNLPAGVKRVPLVDPTPQRRVVLQVRESIQHLDYVQAAIEVIRAQVPGDSGG